MFTCFTSAKLGVRVRVRARGSFRIHKNALKSVWNSLSALKLFFRKSVTLDSAVGGAEIPESSVYNFSGVWICRHTRKAFHQSQQSGRADQSQQTGLLGRRALKRHYTNQTLFERLWNSLFRSVRIIMGISIIQAWNHFLLVAPNAIINPKKR